MTAPLTVGTKIGPYEIVGWLGAGGMGVVYRARDPRLGREVAIKLIPETFAADAGRVHRFEQEARSAGQLNHPNILAVFDVGLHEGAPYIVAELLEGESLRSRLAKGALPSRKAVDYARQIAEGLAAAHDKNIVHRDVKPDNLFITNDGRIKILDFGIAKLTRAGDEGAGHTGLPTQTETGTVVGTAGYMSPEQVRGEPVDARSDLFSFGAILYEMLTGQPAFARETSAETMAAVLKEDPAAPLPATVSPALERIVARCLEKTREMRFQSARDLAFGLEYLSGTAATAVPAAAVSEPRRVRGALAIAIGALAVLTAVVVWATRDRSSVRSIDTLLADAKFTPFTNSEASEIDADISPDGNLVSFLSDQAGPFHVWVSRVSSGGFDDVTPGSSDQRNPGSSRGAGFTGDGSEIWLAGTLGRRLQIVPLTGGARRNFLNEHAVNVAWSRDATRLVYYTFDPGDPVFVADGKGGNPRQILIGATEDHNHFPAWSPDGRWIYYAKGNQTISEFDVWRIPSAGGTPERLTGLNADVRYITPIDDRTVLFVAPDADRAGPWLWALDVERKVTGRVSVGLERYLSVAASTNGRRLVASVATSTTTLWTVPILARGADESDVRPYPLPTAHALAPRFAGPAGLVFLSSSGPGNGLWRYQDGKAVEVWKGADGVVLEPPSVSPRGDRVAIVLRREGKFHITLVSTDGADHRSLADTISVRGTSAWSPDGKWIVTGGDDGHGPGLFTIPVDGGAPRRLVTGWAFDPVWSPDGKLIVYTGEEHSRPQVVAVRPDGQPVVIPATVTTSLGNNRWIRRSASRRFLPNGQGLVYLQGPAGAQSFWLLDLTANQSRLIARLSGPATIDTFDITPDGTRIVFDRTREHSDIRLIDLPK